MPRGGGSGGLDGALGRLLSAVWMQQPAASRVWAGSGKGWDGQERGGLQGEWGGRDVGGENPDPGLHSHVGIGLGLSWTSPPRAGDVQQPGLKMALCETHPTGKMHISF